MHDINIHPLEHPDYVHLFATASEQAGYFTAAQARAAGYRWNLLTYTTRMGRFRRIARGIYRLRDYPSSPHEEIMAAWLAAGGQPAVVSHETALDLLELGDVTPHAIHLLVPRNRRYARALPGVRLHTTTQPLPPDDRITIEGLPVTTATRTILDVIEAGTGLEQIDLAIRQATARGLLLPDDLIRRARQRGGRTAQVIGELLREDGR